MPAQLTDPLHLYRALLRETTYIFDQNARKWSYGYVKSYFHKHAARVYNGKRSQTIPYDPNHAPTLIERHRLKRGRKFLYLLQRANQGHQRQLRGLLELTYGRTGRRKRTLTAQLLHPSLRSKPPSDGAHPDEPTIKFSKDWKPSEDFLSILRTQDQLSRYLNVRKKIKLEPLIEEKNAWGRPMPLSRVKNTTKKWYAKMASIVMPPVSEAEWETLKACSTRKTSLQILPRRPTAKRPTDIGPHDHPETVANTLLDGTERVPGRQTKLSCYNPHKMTARFLSRFYSRHIFNHTPLAIPHPKGKGLVSKWDNGTRRNDLVLPENPRNDTQASTLFD